MTYIIISIASFLIGYIACLLGSFEQLRKGKMFYKRNNGQWYPHDPRNSA